MSLYLPDHIPGHDRLNLIIDALAIHLHGAALERAVAIAREDWLDEPALLTLDAAGRREYVGLMLELVPEGAWYEEV